MKPTNEPLFEVQARNTSAPPAGILQSLFLKSALRRSRGPHAYQVMRHNQKLGFTFTRALNGTGKGDMRSTTLNLTAGSLTPVMWSIFPSWSASLPHVPPLVIMISRARRADLPTPSLTPPARGRFACLITPSATVLFFPQVQDPNKDSPSPKDVHWEHATRVKQLELASGTEQEETIADDAGFTKKHLAHGAGTNNTFPKGSPFSIPPAYISHAASAWVRSLSRLDRISARVLTRREWISQAS